jgi:hypothetical protein
MKDENEFELSELPKGYWIERESDPFILGLRPEKKGCLIPAIFSLLLIYNTLTNSEISLAGAIGLVLFLTCIFLYCLLVANSTDTISISENDVIRFEGTGKIGITKKFKIDEVISIEKNQSCNSDHVPNGKYFLLVKTEIKNYPNPRTIVLLEALTPEKADFIKGILDKTVEERKQDPEDKQDT